MAQTIRYILGCLICFAQKQNSCQPPELSLGLDMNQPFTDSDTSNAAVLGTPINRFLDTCGSSSKNLGPLELVTSVVRCCIGAQGLPEALGGCGCWLQTLLQTEVSVEGMVFSGAPQHTFHTNDYWKKQEGSFIDGQSFRVQFRDMGKLYCFSITRALCKPTSIHYLKFYGTQ